MAFTATISLSPSTVQLNQPSVATITLTNGSSTPVQLTAFVPTVQPTGSSGQAVPFAAAAPLEGVASNNQIPGSSSLTLKVPYVFFSPSKTTYDVSCIVFSQDGQRVVPTAATATVNQLQFNDAAPGYPVNP